MRFPRYPDTGGATGDGAKALSAACVCILLLITAVPAMPAASAEIRFIPMIDIREEYNNNLLFDSSDGSRLHDSITTVSPGFRVTDRTERLNSYLQSWVHEIRYRENDDLDAVDQNHSGQAAYSFTERLRGSVDAGYIRDSRTDRDIETTGLVLGTARRERTHYGGSAGYTLSEKTGLGLSYAYEKDVFEDPEFVDSTRQNASLTLSYDLGSWLPSTVVEVDTRYALFEYPDLRDVTVSCTAGIRKRIDERFSLTAYVGRSRTRSRYETTFLIWDIEESSTFRGTIGELMLSYDGEKTGWNVSLYQDIKALSGEQGAVKRTAAQFGYRYAFTPELEGSVSGEYFLNKAAQGELASEDVDEETLRIQTRLKYRITRDLFLESSYRSTRLKDHEAGLEYVQGLFYLRLVWQYPLPR